MRFIEEEDELGFFRIANFGQGFEQFGEQPEEERRIKLGAAHQLVRSKHIDDAFAILIALDEVINLKRWLTKEVIRTLTFKAQQLALNRAHAALGDIAIFARKLISVFR